MNEKKTPQEIVPLEVDQPIWDRIFTIAPLIVVGTKEADGSYDMAPKHMATPLSWENYFGFVCAPSHGTYKNAKREKSFTVSFPNPEQVVLASLAASPRCSDQTKPVVQTLPTFPAARIDGRFLEESYLFLECEVERIVDGFGPNSLIAGCIVAAHVTASALRGEDKDDQEILLNSPLLTYLSPGRYATVERSNSFPIPTGMRKVPS